MSVITLRLKHDAIRSCARDDAVVMTRDHSFVHSGVQRLSVRCENGAGLTERPSVHLAADGPFMLLIE